MTLISDRPVYAIVDIFDRPKALIGMIHCPAFPGAPRYRGASRREILDFCLRDAEKLVAGGMHGLLVENHGDIPFSKPEDIGPETAAFMAVVADRLGQEFGVPLGINVLANAPIPAFAIAAASDAAFIRVNQWANAYVANEGFMEGRAGEALRYRAQLRAEGIRVFADSHVKHGSHAITADRSVTELTRDLAFFDADAVIATGQRTGDAAAMHEIQTVRAATHLPLLVGSGVTADNIAAILGVVDAVIVASTLKEGGVWWNPVDADRVRALTAAAAAALGALGPPCPTTSCRTTPPCWTGCSRISSCPGSRTARCPPMHCGGIWYRWLPSCALPSQSSHKRPQRSRRWRTRRRRRFPTPPKTCPRGT